MDKRQRRILEEMPKADFLRLALQLLEDKARTMELGGTEVLFGILEGEVHPPGTPAPAGAPSCSLPKGMMRCLRAMGFRNVASLAARKCAEGAKIRIREAMQALRARVSEGQADASYSDSDETC